MYFVLYDRELNSIGETYILEDWSRIQRAVDFDELKITGEQIPYSAEPFCVVVNDKQGRMKFSGLASTPIIDETLKKTSISLKDYTTLFNTEIIVDWSKFIGRTVAEYLIFLLEAWLAQTDVGFVDIQWDLDELSSIELDSSIPLGDSKENVLLYSLISDALNYYGLFCSPDLNVYEKILTFRFRKSGVRFIEIRLRDFGIPVIEKSFGEYSRASVYDYDYSLHSQWALTEDNEVVKLPTESKLVYPSKNRNFVSSYIYPTGSVDDPTEEERKRSDALYDALYDAVMGLAGNRYQENIDLDVQAHKSLVDFTDYDFSWDVNVYTDEGFYKRLPIGEIETSSKGTHIVRLGYRIQELTQEL